MMDEIRYTAVQVSYYVVCPRKLWLFSKGIAQEYESEDVAIGRLIDEVFYKRQRDREEDYTVLMDRLKIDFLTVGDGVIVNEVKKSKALERAHIVQVKYYLWAFKKLGVKVKYGIIRYPKLRRTEKVYLSDEDEREIEEILKGIDSVLSLPVPPPPINASYCKRCAYYSFCYG